MARTISTTRLKYRKLAPPAVRVQRRKPTPGQFHPIEKPELVSLLERFPPVCLSELKMIELRPRVAPVMEQPLGVYYAAEKTIRLFSFPEGTEWAGDFENSIFKRFGAEITPSGLSWSKAKNGLWLCQVYVLCHEVGHHYVYRNKLRRRLPADTPGHENRAEDYGVRLFSTVLKDDPRRPSETVFDSLLDNYLDRLDEKFTQVPYNNGSDKDDDNDG